MDCCGLFSAGSKQGRVEGSYEHGNDPSGSVIFWGNFSVAERLTASKEGLSSLELL
jgi:hypothetical protein